MIGGVVYYTGKVIVTGSLKLIIIISGIVKGDYFHTLIPQNLMFIGAGPIVIILPVNKHVSLIQPSTSASFLFSVPHSAPSRYTLVLSICVNASGAVYNELTFKISIYYIVVEIDKSIYQNGAKSNIPFAPQSNVFDIAHVVS